MNQRDNFSIHKISNSDNDSDFNKNFQLNTKGNPLSKTAGLETFSDKDTNFTTNEQRMHKEL